MLLEFLNPFTVACLLIVGSVILVLESAFWEVVYYDKPNRISRLFSVLKPFVYICFGLALIIFIYVLLVTPVEAW